MAAIPVGSGTSSSSSSQIFQQIEATADYYPPDTYRQLLTFYDDFVLNTDPAGGQFMPLTTTSTRWGEQSILFAVGIIPPAANVTGRLLDRSASVANVAGVAGISTTPTAPTNSGPTTTVSQNPTVTSQTGNDRAALLQDKQFWINYVAMAGRLGVDPSELAKVINQESSWNPNANNGNVAKGLNQIHVSVYKNTGMTTDTFNNFQNTPGSDQLPYMEKSLRGVRGKNAGQIYQQNAGGFNIPGFAGPVYMSKDHFNGLPQDQQDAITQALGGRLGTLFAGYAGNKGADADGNGVLDGTDWAARVSGPLRSDVAAAIDEAKAAIQAGATPTTAATSTAIAGDSSSGGWQNKGSASAQTASQQQAQYAGTPLSSTQTGQDITAAQKNAIQATQQAITNMSNAPPLAMMVNPASFAVKGEKIVSDGSWGRNGPIIEFWGDQQDKISGSGKVAAFFALDNQNASGPGITRWARNYSASWQNFQSLFELYRSNGALFLPDATTATSSGVASYQNLSMLGSIYIYYDTVIYIGSFDSFSVTESDTTPHTIEYSFEFTVRASFLLDRTDDAFNYGVPQITVGGSIPFQATQPLPFGGGAPPIGTPEAAAFAASSQGLGEPSTATTFNPANGSLAQQIAARVGNTNKAGL